MLLKFKYALTVAIVGKLLTDLGREISNQTYKKPQKSEWTKKLD